MLKGSRLHSQWSDLAEIRTRPRFYACSRYLQVQKGSDQKQPRKGGDTIFPIIIQWGLSVAMDTICLKTLRSLSPHPVMLHTQFDQDWPIGLRDIQVRESKIFIIQGQVT